MIRTMVVEDEKLTRRYLMSLIPRMNHAFQIVASGENGKDALKQMEKIPVDMVISDIRMPHMDGLEFIEQIRRKYPHVMIVLLSGFSEFEYARKAIQNGVIGYLLKPIIHYELKEILGQAEVQWESMKKRQQSEDVQKKLTERAGNILISDYIRASALGREYEMVYCREQMKRAGISVPDFPLLYLKLSVPEAEGEMQKWMKTLIPAITEEKVMGRMGWVFADEQGGFVLIFSAVGLGRLEEWMQRCYKQLALLLPESFHEGNLTGFLVKTQQELEYADNWCQAAAVLYGMRKIYMTELGDTNRQDTTGRIWILSKEKAEHVMELQKAALRMKNALEKGDSVVGEASMVRLHQYFLELFPWISVKDYIGYINRFLFFSEKAIPYTIQENEDILLHSLAESFIRMYAEKRQHMEKNHVVMDALKYIQKNYCEYISLEAVAEKVGVSASYLSSVFHKYMGESYSGYLTRLRMEAAAEMLMTRQKLRLADISEQVGYVSLRHFLKVFKNYYGMTPTEYRRSHEKKSEG